MEHDKPQRLTFLRPDAATPPCEVPVAGSSVHAGFPSPADDFLDAPLDLNREFVRNPASTFFVRVAGDSMTGAGIDDGDLLIVDKSVEPHDGCIAVCCLDGEFTVKRIRRERDVLWLQPANPAYPAIRVAAADELVVWGVVRHVIKSFR